MGAYLQRDLCVLLPDGKGGFLEQLFFDTKNERATDQESLSEEERVVATWCWRNGCVAGRSSDTLPNAEHLFMPVVQEHNTLAVVGLPMEQKLLLPEERTLLEAWLGLLGMLLAKAKLAKQAKEIAILQ